MHIIERWAAGRQKRSAVSGGIVAAILLATTTLARAGSPVGTWRSIDDNTRQERSIIRISEVNGELKGVVDRIFPQPGDDPAFLCKECGGERKDQPIVGMTILWGMRKDGNIWTGGRILDPENGEVYRCSMRLSEDGQTLILRGFIGISLIGRSQTWLRQE